MTNLPPIPENPGAEILSNCGEITRYRIGKDTPEARRQTVRLLSEVPVEQRIPSFKQGRNRCSFTSWVDDWYERMVARAREGTHDPDVTNTISVAK